MIFFFILITCLLDVVLILLGEILSWSLMQSVSSFYLHFLGNSLFLNVCLPYFIVRKVYLWIYDDF